MDHFTPWSSLMGGILIGCAVTGMLLLNGRITGISGILSQAIFNSKERGWRICFLGGLLLAGFLGRIWISPQELPVIEVSTTDLVYAGLLVGFGTRLGSGCTSGHGICGIARLSKRSLIATAVFMLAGVVTVFLFRMVLS